MNPSPESFAAYFAQVQATPGWDAILQSFARFAEVPPNSRVLDVGCGPGALARHLVREGHAVIGIDADPLMIERAQYLSVESKAQFEVGDVTCLRFADSSFDVVLATNVLFLTPDPVVGLREMARVVRKGGIVAMLNPSPKMSVAAATAQADKNQLEGVARVSIINWAKNAEANHRISLEQAQKMFAEVGLTQFNSVEKVGAGLALLARGVKAS
jgi:ubiquinone/menaquinone biosynthesis C-methylase UbiE